jgi:hypothetical protein
MRPTNYEFVWHLESNFGTFGSKPSFLNMKAFLILACWHNVLTKGCEPQASLIDFSNYYSSCKNQGEVVVHEWQSKVLKMNEFSLSINHGQLSIAAVLLMVEFLICMVIQFYFVSQL